MLENDNKKSTNITTFKALIRHGNDPGDNVPCEMYSIEIVLVHIGNTEGKQTTGIVHILITVYVNQQ